MTMSHMTGAQRTKKTMPPKTTLLFMDDDPAILKMVGIFFKKHGFVILLAEDGEKGLELFHAQQPDIVLVDLRMPKVDGFAVLDTVRKESPDTPIIVISGEGEKADVIKALRLGAWNYHAKPIDNYKVILHAVEQALEKARLIKEVKTYQKGLERKLSTLIENFPGFIYTCDKNHRISYMNPALEAYVGQDALGSLCHQTIFGQETQCSFCPDNNQYVENIVKFDNLSANDNRWYHAIQVPSFDDNGQITERQNILYDITDRKKALLDLQEQEKYLRKENIRLRSSLTDRYKFGDIIGKSTPMQEVYETIINAAAADANVIIYGESGTGKELVAKAIHETSYRKDKQLVYVNCGAIPENLIESEFFGYKRGAFTGAAMDKVGYLEIAAGGTLFLDEIGEIPMSMQIKLLRAIEGGGFTPVGGNRVKKPDIRIIAATNRDLKEKVKKGEMRQDFLYRIHIIPIQLPPLRKRKEDLALLIDHFLKQYKPDQIPPISPAIKKALEEYEWPGNVRELQNTIHRFVTLKKLDFMGLAIEGNGQEDLLQGINTDSHDRSMSDILEEVEQKILQKTFKKFNWHKGKTAKVLGMAPKTLYRKMKQYGIEKPSSN
jgi:DNA-binding NtrC family response regulator